MKIGVIGLGKMGQLVRDIARQRGHEVCTIDPNNDSADFQTIQQAPVPTFDICIEFSHPDSVLDTISHVLKSGVPLVVGTTGWYEEIDRVRAEVEAAGTAFLFASNFSIGVHIFAEVLRHASALFNRFDQYDAAGFEAHHNQKADSPSGTARTLADIVLQGLDRKEKLVFGSPDRTIEPNELQFASMRCGSIPGVHEVFFDSEVDSIRLSHSARNRSGFAMGAVQAAEWLQGKQGFFSIADLIQDAL